MSKWKNRPDGVTVRRNTLSKYFSSRPVELLQSPALRVLSRAAHLALIRIEIELRRHAGQCNGKLIVTHEQFIEFGIHRNIIASALRELEALGLIRIEHGRGGNAEHRQPNRFFLNYLCGATDAHGDITNAWKRFQSPQEAEQVAISARAAKNQAKVAYGRRNTGRRKNISRNHPHKVGPRPPPQSGGETAKSPPPKSGGTAHPQKVGALSILSGGGGAAGGSFPSEPAAGVGHNLGPPLVVGNIPWSTPHIEEVFERPRTATLLSLIRR